MKLKSQLCDLKLDPSKDLDREGDVYGSYEVVHFLPSVLVYRGADGPDEAEGEPELHHSLQVLRI